jgi:hypothetical protein
MGEWRADDELVGLNWWTPPAEDLPGSKDCVKRNLDDTGSVYEAEKDTHASMQIGGSERIHYL